MTHFKAKLVQHVLKVLVDMRQATNPVPEVRCFELRPRRGIGTMLMQVHRARVADSELYQCSMFDELTGRLKGYEWPSMIVSVCWRGPRRFR